MSIEPQPNTIKVSVLVPHLNDPVGLHQSLNSIGNQEGNFSFQVCVVDDGSTKTIQNQITNIMNDSGLDCEFYFFHETQGRPTVRNKLLDMAKGEFITWLDAGDEWHHQKTQVQFQAWLEIIKSEDIDYKALWISCNYTIQFSDGRSIFCKQIPKDNPIYELTKAQNFRAYLWTVFAHQDTYSGLSFDEKLLRLQDLDIFLKFLLRGGVFEVPSDLSLCVYNKTMQGKDPKQLEACYRIIYQKHQDLLEKCASQVNKIYWQNAYLNAANFSKGNREYLLYLRYILRALFVDPAQFAARVFKKIKTKL